MKMSALSLLVLVSLGVSVAATKIPLQPFENTHVVPKALPITDKLQSLPIYYVSDENVDRYPVPTDPHKPEEVLRHTVPTPATYLLPPSADRQNEYFVNPTEPGEQTEWYPISAAPTKQQDEIPLIQQEVLLNPNEERPNLRTGKVMNRGQVITVPSRNLLPPIENAQDDFVILSPSPELELPLEEIDHIQNQKLSIKLSALRPHLQNPHQVLRASPENFPVPYIIPPENVQQRHNPTWLYPKKYINEFKPIPIPVSEYKEESDNDTPAAKPEQLTQSKEKKNYLYEESQKKRKHQKEAVKPVAATGTHYDEKPAEQEVSESNHRQHGNHIRPTHSRKEPIRNKPEHKSKGERTEFRMHGMKGPHSYQFGYDTGKGKNRQFRYEERDNDGHVRGHYGYVDKFGKLRVVNYDADPELGFRAEAPVVTD